MKLLTVWEIPQWALSATLACRAGMSNVEHQMLFVSE